MRIIQNKYWLIYLFIICSYRTKRVVGNNDTTAEVTIETQTTESPSAIYIITGYNYSGTTIDTTLYTSVSSTLIPTTNSLENGTYIITNFISTEISTSSTTTISSTTSSTTSTTTSTTSTTTSTTSTTPAVSTTITTTPLSSNYCINETHVLLTNGTCVSRQSLINSAIDTLNSSSANDTQKANAISTYITAVTNLNTTSNLNNTITLGQIDQSLGNLSSQNYTVQTDNSIIVITKPDPCSNATNVIGASFETDNDSVVVNTDNIESVKNSVLKVAGVVNFTTECFITNFNMLIINNPTIYQNIDNSSNKTVVSSIVIGTISKKGGDPVDIIINLYFQVLDQSKTADNGNFSCVFYNTTTLHWSDDGCTPPEWNPILARYECQCNHLTSFALIWLPKLPLTDGERPELDSQDKASIAFQLISIVCFLGIIIHAVIVRIVNPQKYVQTSNLLPILSCGITMILFIFYIALGLTVYTRRVRDYDNSESPSQQGRSAVENFNGKNLPTESILRAGSPSSNLSSPYIPCLPNEQGLMFTVYFLIIFMFCSKTSIGLFNYRRYVQLFPPPSLLMLIITMIISFFISVIWLVFAVGFNSRPSNELTEIYADKICWFNTNVNHYFLTIPVVIFLVINLAMFILVVKHNITHAQIDDDKLSYYIRRKRCIYIILASCVTQGFGWLFGVVISFTGSETAGEVLGWFFVIFNGLEGLWIILLYIVVEKEGIDHTVRYKDDKNTISKDDEIDLYQIQINNLSDERRRDPLTTMISDSPRNSFADFSQTQPHHRSYQVKNEYYC